MRLIVFIFFICVVFVSCNKDNNSSSIQISSESAVKIISSGSVLDFRIDTVIHQERDSIYSLLVIDPDVDKNIFSFFFKHKTSFYVFQDNKMIYKNLSNEFYKNENIKSADYILYPDMGKTFHRIVLKSDSSLYFLVKHLKKNIVTDFFETRNLNRFPKKDLITGRIPLIEISTLNTSISDNGYKPSKIKISTHQEVLDISGKLKIRGSSSKNFPKKQLSIKTSEPIFFEGVSLSKSVLYAPYIDKSLFRNKLTYDLYVQMSGISNPSVFTNVLLNGDYYGLYLLVAHPKEQFKQLINSSDSSSFLVQIDRCPCEIKHRINSNKTAYIIESPGKCLEQTKAQIDEQLRTFEQALVLDDLTSLDLNSFIDFIILNELSKNVDAYRLSTYLAFYGNKFRLPIVWDYNIAWGLADYGNGIDPEGFVINGVYQEKHLFWWDNLWNNKMFQSALRTRYGVLRKNILSNDNILQLIQLFENELEENVTLNFKKWPLMGQKIWPSKHKTITHNEELEILKSWLDERLVWLDGQWGSFSF